MAPLRCTTGSPPGASAYAAVTLWQGSLEKKSQEQLGEQKKKSLLVWVESPSSLPQVRLHSQRSAHQMDALTRCSEKTKTTGEKEAHRGREAGRGCHRVQHDGVPS